VFLWETISTGHRRCSEGATGLPQTAQKQREWAEHRSEIRSCAGGPSRERLLTRSSNDTRQELTLPNIITVTKHPMNRCAWCGGVFGKTAGQGRPKRYCRPSHRRRAYESRRLATSRGLEGDDVLISRSSLEAHREQLYLLEAAYEDVLTDSVDATAPQMLTTVRSLRQAVEAAVACGLEIRATGA